MAELLCFIRTYTNKTKGNKFAKCDTTPNVIAKARMDVDQDLCDILSSKFDEFNDLHAPNKNWHVKPCQGETTIPLKDGVYTVVFREVWHDTREGMVEKDILRIKGDVAFHFIKAFDEKPSGAQKVVIDPDGALG